MKLKIDGVGTVNVGDEFANMAPDAQNAFVAHIAEQAKSGVKSALPAGLQPDKYQAAAQENLAKLKKGGLGESGYSQRILSGMTLGASDEILAGLETPIEMVRQGTFSPVEGFKYAKAFQDERNKQARDATGLLGNVAELAGSVLTGGNIANAGGTLLRAGQSLPARAGAMAGEGAAYGGVSGFNEGDGFTDRLKGAAGGAAAGGLLGGAIPAVGAAARTVASPVVSNIAARIDPEGSARARVARAIGESGQTPAGLASELQNASAAGQGEFALADAMGNPGQRLLSTVARAPGEGRTRVVETMNARQAGQAERVGGQIDEALGADQTGRQFSAQRLAQARRDAGPLYRQANEYPIQWNDRIEQFVQDPVAQKAFNRGIEIQRLESLANNPVHNPRDFTAAGYAEATGAPDVLAAGPNMRSLDAIKKGLDDILEGYRDKTTGRLQLDEYGRSIDQVRRSLLNELDAISPVYRQARAAYAGPASEREAVNFGQQAASRGRAADNLDTFGRLNAPQQGAYRIGYADKLAEGVERGAEGVNAARKFTSGKYQEELPALSLHQGPSRPGDVDELTRRLGRERTMFETRRQATGGSQTAENLADQAENQIDPRVFSNLLRGDLLGAGRQAFMGAGNVVGGNTPAVRGLLADMLLSRDGATVENLMRNLGRDATRGRAREEVMTRINRGLLSGGGEYAGSRVSR
jgi:hypothetical protein